MLNKDKITQELLQEKEAIIIQLKEYDKEEKQGISSDSRSEEFEMAGEQSAKKITNILEFRLTKRLEQIEHAFLRLENGTFGICEECSDTISENRLHANINANLCIDCQQELEFKKKKVA